LYTNCRANRDLCCDDGSLAGGTEGRPRGGWKGPSPLGAEPGSDGEVRSAGEALELGAVEPPGAVCWPPESSDRTRSNPTPIGSLHSPPPAFPHVAPRLQAQPQKPRAFDFVRNEPCFPSPDAPLPDTFPHPDRNPTNPRGWLHPSPIPAGREGQGPATSSRPSGLATHRKANGGPATRRRRPVPAPLSASVPSPVASRSLPRPGPPAATGLPSGRYLGERAEIAGLSPEELRQEAPSRHHLQTPSTLFRPTSSPPCTPALAPPSALPAEAPWRSPGLCTVNFMTPGLRGAMRLHRRRVGTGFPGGFGAGASCKTPAGRPHRATSATPACPVDRRGDRQTVPFCPTVKDGNTRDNSFPCTIILRQVLTR